eukprot:Rhum_TRINITY_DN18509_c0_g1::Rhum_TRINITY_DN18509_c0_g1_i1::g.167541::m.167541/K12830/SF3B3, SAP130, RSE1; splicing factor 3B subunit 3
MSRHKTEVGPLRLYHLTLERGGSVSCTAHGSFSAPKQHEVVCGRGTCLELLSVSSTGAVTSTSVQHTFGLVRRVEAFRLPGQNKDYLVVTSDSGRIVVLEFDAKAGTWTKVHQETYGKTGVRRAVAGEYLATDPKGRALMIGALEKQKFVYVLKREENNLTISSPQEAHKSNTITYSMVGLDVGYENPVFAAVEVDHSELDEDHTVADAEKYLILYEFDLGLNHVVRKSPWLDTPLPATANLLFAVPGGDTGPGGVIVCVDNYLLYMKPGHQTLKEVLPRRQDMGLPSNGLMIVCGSVIKNVPRKGDFFFLLQSEYGDLYKVTLSTTPEKDLVREMEVKYFDTIPVCTSMEILKAGYLFAASEFSNHAVYKFKGLGDKEEEVVFGGMNVVDPVTKVEELFPLFNPRSLKNLVMKDEIKSLSPLIDLQVGDGAGDTEAKRLFALCGRGAQSSLRVVRNGLSLFDLGSLTFPGTPQRVWTLKKLRSSPYDDYLVVSFINATLVFSITVMPTADATKVEIHEVHDSQLVNQTPTLCCITLADDSLLQVHQTGIRHIRKDRRVSNWKTAGAKHITHADANERQVIIALGSGELIYFELDSYGAVNEVCKKELNREVACLGIGPVPQGSIRSRFLAVGLTEKLVQVISLDVDDNMGTLARQACNSEPTDIKIVDMETEMVSRESALCMYIGCANGILVRSVLDKVTGEITDARTRFCGTLPCKLVATKAAGRTAVMVLSSRSWLAYFYQNRYHLSPFSSPPFAHATPLSTASCAEGIAAVSGSSLAVYSLESLGTTFNQQATDLKATPRGFAKHSYLPHLCTIESDHRSYTDEEKQMVKAQYKAQLAQSLGEDAANTEDLPEKEYGSIKAPQGKWCSYIRVFDMDKQVTHDLIELEENLTALCVATVVFHDTGGDVHLVVGAVKDYVPNPKSYSTGMVLTFKFKHEGKQLELVHKTIVDGMPKALHAFQGRLLVGVDNRVKIYDLGKTKLLNRCENRQVPNMVSSLTSSGNRIFVGDITDSVYCLKYKREENKLTCFADDTTPRWTTCITALDHYTIAIGDKLGNITVCRLDENVSDDVDNDRNIHDDPTSAKWLQDKGFLNGAPQRLAVVASFFVGSGITSIQTACLTTGGIETVLYTTMNGSIGCLVPITSRRDAHQLQLLEMLMRQESPPLCGRDHLAFRSYYSPQRCVTDGDLAETYAQLPYATQEAIAEELNKKPQELLKRLEELRNKVL